MQIIIQFSMQVIMQVIMKEIMQVIMQVILIYWKHKNYSSTSNPTIIERTISLGKPSKKNQI